MDEFEWSRENKFDVNSDCSGTIKSGGKMKATKKARVCIDSQKKKLIAKDNDNKNKKKKKTKCNEVNPESDNINIQNKNDEKTKFVDIENIKTRKIKRKKLEAGKKTCSDMITKSALNTSDISLLSFQKQDSLLPEIPTTDHQSSMHHASDIPATNYNSPDPLLSDKPPRIKPRKRKLTVTETLANDAEVNGELSRNKHDRKHPRKATKPELFKLNKGLEAPVTDDSAASVMDVFLDISCGTQTATLKLGELDRGSKGSCILFDGVWITPNRFQLLSGRGKAKDWKRSIRHHGKSLKTLTSDGLLSILPALCLCEKCDGKVNNYCSFVRKVNNHCRFVRKVNNHCRFVRKVNNHCRFVHKINKLK